MTKQRIIVVGNASSLLEKTNGEVIDSFDRIIRCNSFRTKGFEKYTGKKIDIVAYVPTGAGCLELLRKMERQSLRVASEVWMSRPKYLCKDEHTKLKCLVAAFHKKIVYPNREMYDALMARCNEIDPRNKHPSTGMVAIEMCLSMNKYDVFITGFDFFKSGHYYGNLYFIKSKHHPIKAEKQIIDQYILDGRVKSLESIL